MRITSKGSITSQIFFPSRLEKECAQKPLEASPELAETPTSLPQKNIALKEMLMKFQGREKPGRRGLEVAPGSVCSGFQEGLSRGEVLVQCGKEKPPTFPMY